MVEYSWDFAASTAGMSQSTIYVRRERHSVRAKPCNSVICLICGRVYKMDQTRRAFRAAWPSSALLYWTTGTVLLACLVALRSSHIFLCGDIEPMFCYTPHNNTWQVRTIVFLTSGIAVLFWWVFGYKMWST